MLDSKIVKSLNTNLQRIFLMPIVRSTLREIQSGFMMATNNNQELASKLFESLVVAKIPKEWADHANADKLKSLIKQFSLKIRLAKDIYEKGEFINVISSDLVDNKGQAAFFNSIRRVDGKELQFVSDTDSTVHLLNHFVARIQDLKKNNKPLDEHKDNFKKLAEMLSQL
jgi:hypothetical protein